MSRFIGGTEYSVMIAAGVVIVILRFLVNLITVI